MAAKRQAIGSVGRKIGRRIGKLSGGKRFMVLRLLPSAALATLIALPGSVDGDGDEPPRQEFSFEPSGSLFSDGADANLEARASLADEDGDDAVTEVGVGPDSTDPADQWDASTAAVIDSLGRSGIPEVALQAYVRAQDTMAVSDPECHVGWSLLAGIGRVESNHGRFGGAQLRADGYGTEPIRGIPLDGRPGVALIRDTDDGRYDGDAIFDRAVGPMQFIPSSWPRAAADGNGDGRSDPDNIFDAALAAARYLCSGGGDLRGMADRRAAVLRYNHSQEYADVVLSLAAAYEQGRTEPLPHVEPAPDPPPAVASPPTPPAASVTDPPTVPSTRPPSTPPSTSPTTHPPSTTTSTTRPCPTTTLPPTTTTTTAPGSSTTTPTTAVPPAGSEPIPGCPTPTTTTTTTAPPTTTTTAPPSTTTQTTAPASTTSSSSSSTSAP